MKHPPDLFARDTNDTAGPHGKSPRDLDALLGLVESPPQDSTFTQRVLQALPSATEVVSRNGPARRKAKKWGDLWPGGWAEILAGLFPRPGAWAQPVAALVMLGLFLGLGGWWAWSTRESERGDHPQAGIDYPAAAQATNAAPGDAPALVVVDSALSRSVEEGTDRGGISMESSEVSASAEASELSDSLEDALVVEDLDWILADWQNDLWTQDDLIVVF